MKFIISHDIDHFYWSDHFFKDLFIPKYIIKNTLFFFKGQIPFTLYLARLKAFSSNRFSRLLELVDFNEKNEVPASYFMGVRNALNLSYSEHTAASIAAFLRKRSIPVYLHGIAYDEIEKMREEKEILQRITSQNIDGIRMHYLRNSGETIQLIAKLNYSFDSTLYKLEDPYFVGDTVEFPVSMMEVYML